MMKEEILISRISIAVLFTGRYAFLKVDDELHYFAFYLLIGFNYSMSIVLVFDIVLVQFFCSAVERPMMIC